MATEEETQSMAASIADDDDEDNNSQAEPEADNNIRIFLRVKPTKKPSGFFAWNEDESIMRYDIPKDMAAGLINNSRTNYKFRFDAIIGMEAKQEEVFDRVGRPCVLNALNGFNSTVFAYGQTGSGKTFTITGGAERYEDRGLIPRALSMIFEQAKNPQRQVQVHISYLEIYNNQGYDLLDPNHESTKSLEDLPRVSMLEDEDGNCHLRNLSMHLVHTEEDALNLLFLGDTNRAVSETAMNLASSRSHCIFTVSLETRRTGSEVVLRSKLHMVDLAGSERAHKTGSKGQQFREATFINTSLHYLEMVIVALHEKNTKGRTHIPYRNSMMTSVLRDSLGGNCKTVMVATVSAEREQTDESVSTCRFAQRVARVRNDARLNEEVDPQVIIRQLKAQLAGLQEEMAILKGDAKEGDELKDYEKDKLRQRCVDYVNDAEPTAHLSMGEFTYTKMKMCFHFLKELVLNAAGGSAPTGVTASGSASVSKGRLISAGSGGNNQELEQRVQELEQLVQQRDNEIAIMVNMIRKQRGEDGIPTEALLKRGSSNNNQLTEQKPASKSSKKDAIDNDPSGGIRVDPAILDDPVKAFEAFKAQYPKNNVIRENKMLLKTNYDAAKALASSVNDARNQIKELTTQMDKLRKQQAMTEEGLVGESGDAKSVGASAEESKLKDKIDQYKAQYKTGFNNLSELKKEIQHIQKMLEMSRIKLQKDFDLWYQRQGKGALLTEALVAQPKQSGREMESVSPPAPAKSASPVRSTSKMSQSSRPESAGKSMASSESADSKKTMPHTRSSTSSSISISVNTSNSASSSSVDEDVSGFYAALDILKRRNQMQTQSMRK
ncbi:TPA: hypothetical protein N0F65_003744 [Lagenidium giganteum]|uniref:Kinesin-like protein n=1 Tax=Lagenidium giganteum TaxID=4803 RepID=A0AAV2YKB2_9STRA|nr:TPA: hypothetical protein N0F65_003744 [Lagenidium giganteum]